MGRPTALLTFAICLLAAIANARADLATDIDSVLHDKLLARAAVGIDIVRLGSSAGDVSTLYQCEATL